MKGEPNDTSDPTMLRLWLIGARPRTLSAAIVAVAVGTAAAVGHVTETGEPVAWWRAGAALIVALALQIGVNYANDYSDGVRGTDGATRVGPIRLVGSKLVSPKAMKRAAATAFAVAGAAGATLAWVIGPELLVVGAASILAGWTYTGGPKPYAHRGLGEVFVFVFFGLVATAGTTYVLVERLEPLAVAAGAVVGLWAVTLLIINNLRDIPGDTLAGKFTLAVRLGDRRTRNLYVLIQVGAAVGTIVMSIVWTRPAAVALVALPLIIKAVSSLRCGAVGEELIPLLGITARIQAVGGLALAAGLAVSG